MEERKKERKRSGIKEGEGKIRRKLSCLWPDLPYSVFSGSVLLEGQKQGV